MKVMNMVAAVAVMASASQFAVGQSSTNRAEEQQSVQEQQRRDQLRVAVQEICPVSGGNLGSMGAPIKVQVGQETIFLCSRGCLQQKINPQHWATIHANIARAQQICPVMENDLPKSPKWTIVEGQVVYVCCPPCTKKIVTDPQSYLRAVDELYAASLEARQPIR